MTDFLLGGYQKLPKASSFLGLACREPKIYESFLTHQSSHSDFYVESMKESGQLNKPNDDNSAQTESAPACDGRVREDIMVIDSFLNSEMEYGYKLCIGPCTTRGEGFYYDAFYDDDYEFKKIHAQATKDATEKKQPFERIEVSRQQALEMFTDNPFKV